jgi:hypothetical protein
VKEYDIFLPLTYNDGTLIEPQKYQILRERLLEQFGALTYFPQSNEGFWRMGDVLYQDEIVIFRVLAAKVRTARRFLTTLKEELKRDFRQEEILIIERDVETL